MAARWIPVVAWLGVIYWLSSMPRYYPESLRRASVPENPAKTAAHVVANVVLAWSFLYALGAQRPWARYVLTALLGAAAALLDEYHQTFVATRESTPADVVADLVGIAVGTATWALVVRARVDAAAVWLRGVLNCCGTPSRGPGP